MATAPSPAALVGPCIERILQGATGRKYAKMRQDAQSLLDKIDTLLVVQGAAPPSAPVEEAAPAESPVAAAGAGSSAEPAPPPAEADATGEAMAEAEADLAADEVAAVSLEEGADGQVAFKLTLSPSKLAEAEAAQDRGHMPVSPSAASPASRPPLPRRRDVTRPGALYDGAARELLCLLRDAVDTRKPPLMEVSLDCIQKLISFKLLQGPVHHINHRRDSSAKKPEDESERGPAGMDFDSLPPQAQAVELVCRCDDVSDDAVELRLLKALLTAVTSTTLAVHGQALLLVVRACYNIFLTSRSDVNQATAKATLTQMLNVVFQRMEAGSAAVVVPPIMVSDLLGLPPADASNMSAFVQQFLADVVATVDPFGTVTQAIQEGLDDAFVSQAPILGEEGAEDLYDPSDPTDRQQIEWRQTAQEKQQQQQAAEEEAAGGEGASTPARATSSAAGDLASHGSETTQGISGDASSGKQLSVPAQLQKDAFLVFRALCKLSIRSTEAAPGSEITTIRGKVLALELLKILLENSGPLFQTGERFVSAIKQYLCLSLLKNCQSAVPAGLRLCCSIFLTLMTKFRQNLKAEIGVFFPMILLRPIEPPVGGSAANAQGGSPAPVDIAHKAVVLRCIQAQCEDGQLLVDLFVNYDCDLEGANLYERMVTALVRIAQGSLSHEAGAAAVAPLEEQAIRYEALRCLVAILKSMAAWHTSATSGAAAAAASAAAAAAPNGQAPAPPTAAPTVGEEAVDEAALQSGFMARMAEAGGTEAAEAGGERQAVMLESWKGYKRQFQQGITLFNQKPKKGIAFMQEQGVVGTAPSDVAQFLARTQGLSKTLIGDYLGERDDFNLKVMHSYVDALEFTTMDFDDAIRKFLSGFRLPGEAQKIDRLMEKFAERFVSCNPDSFKSADVAYVLAYSVIMLNTDAHNTQVKNKMSKADFLRNNRGINDGGDLPQDFMEAVYDRIIHNEIKMKDESLLGGGADAQKAAAAGAGWLDTIMNLLPGRAKAASAEPNDEAIRRTHEHLREKAKGVTFFEAHDSEAIRPMLDVSWAPLLGAFSVLFEEQDDEYFIGLCLEGFVSCVRLTSLLDVVMLRNTFVTSLARFTMLHSPASMKLKHARAFRALLIVAEQNGNHLRECWTEVLRCVSRFELLQQLTAGVPTDALLFAMPDKAGPGSSVDKLKRRILQGRSGRDKGSEGLGHDSFSSINDMGLHASAREVDKKHLPPPDVMMSVDVQELNRLFVNSGRLDSEAIVHFVRTLSAIAAEELRPVACPRVFSLTKIVEIAHFNMGRIRLVWSRIWAVLADFFIEVGCHQNLSVAMYAVDSLRQLAMKFLERDELSNFSFQNDFLRPFVVVMRHSGAVEIRELIIRCVSQMVLARVGNVKSGWKSMFMVFTTAASDESPQIVRLAFDTVEKIVREHFHFITETETTTFTDCVNCLIAFTNNPHSLDVSLNAIAFLRFCALALAEGDIGDVDGELPEGSLEAAGRQLDPNAYRIRPKGQDATSPMRGRSDDAAPQLNGGALAVALEEAPRSPPGAPAGGARRIRFTDKDEHMYFWFPLLAGLSELTFDPRPEIRYSALEVLFDILKFHGASFSPPFWMRVFDSVLLPIFDHVRAEVTDTTTFTDDKRRAEVDSWLYDTCTRTLQHIVDLVVQYYAAVRALLDRILDLLLGFVGRTHLALAGVGVAALVRLLVQAGSQMDEPTWMMMLGALSTAAGDTMPNVSDLIQHRMSRRTNDTDEYSPSAAGNGSSGGEEGGEPTLREHFGVQSPPAGATAGAGRAALDRRPTLFSLGAGAGQRRLADVHVRAAIQLLLVQACSEVYGQHSRIMPAAAAVLLLDTLKAIASHAASVDADGGLCHSLLLAQAADKVAPERVLPDPPLLRLEAEASQAYLSVLLHVQAVAPDPVKAACTLEARLTQLCLRNLERFEQQEAEEEAAAAAAEEEGGRGGGLSLSAAAASSHREENAALAPLAVATLRALLLFSPDAFRAHLKDFFPLLTALISCEYAPPEVQRALSELFQKRIGPMLGSA
ncbi:brefeldin A-inhibited guanine nucleotide-exchange 2-like [Micractinium conductrix]|uniref:Brefeldin A-inhibited guanine nucleotide-exchange 2-like n=1 Tax=Micractinium conductrix TaxID=554055 RepID=A0A2P6VDW3_9CHLO|nr:brefeldin A-inhibited guanine nucleotide-exchange 2-like [Micractinium conductrix]|eukprot:PSC72251.1 brefeldin A-inhibited guanine nucleotide-exchange 2-like [Micractinium conductrix]